MRNLYRYLRQRAERPDMPSPGMAEANWLTQTDQFQHILVIQPALKQARRKIERDTPMSGPATVTGADERRKAPVPMAEVKEDAPADDAGSADARKALPAAHVPARFRDPGRRPGGRAERTSASLSRKGT